MKFKAKSFNSSFFTNRCENPSFNNPKLIKLNRFQHKYWAEVPIGGPFMKI